MAQLTTLTVSEETKANIDALAHERGLSIDELLRELFEKLGFTSRFEIPFMKLHNSMVEQAEAMGIFSEDDVLDQIS